MWKNNYIIPCIVAILLLFLGCAAKNTSSISRDYKEMGVRLIALMPVDNTSADESAPQILRQGVLEKLYFKGYPKIPLHIIDEKIADMQHQGAADQSKKISPHAI